MTVPSSVQLEVALQQALESLAVTGLVASHLIVSPTGRPLRVLWESWYQAVFQRFLPCHTPHFITSFSKKVPHEMPHDMEEQMMSKTNNSGVYQLENGNWGYRFTLTENGHRRDIRRIKDNDGNVFTSKTAATRARSLALADYLDGQKKKQIKRKTVREIYQEYREKGSSSKKYPLFEYPLLGLDGASPAEKLPLLCHLSPLRHRRDRQKRGEGISLSSFKRPVLARFAYFPK